mmetsp:Transcript_351/g.1239  ORF Transcript_351/g.1239 Transcript_351/m.1239 type:complete len:294 (+) Transcript_351:1173-2054(+)
MRRAAQAPPPSPAPALFHGLEYIREPKAWRDALKHCDMLGGSLVAITSQERNWEVHGLIEGDTWIGASDVAAEGRWVWPDGSPVTLLSLQMEGPSILFSGWEEGKPNNNEDPDLEHDCGQMRLSGRWDDTDCDMEHPFICDMGEPPPTTLDLLTRKQVVILVDTIFVCLTLCACLFMCCVYRRYSRYLAKISREDLQRLTPTRAPTRTGADDLSAPGLSPIEETSERPYTPTNDGTNDGTGEDDAEEGGAAPDGYGGVEDLRDRVRAHLQRCSGLSPSRAHGMAGSVATYASI